MSQATSEQPKVILHWLEKSRAQRIVWLLEECKIPYEIKTYKRKDRLAPPELKSVHPLGKSPVITVEVPGQSQPITLAESANITEFFCGHYATHLLPKQYKEGQEGKIGGETEGWLRYRYLMHYAEGTLMSLLVVRVLFGALTGPDIPFLVKPITRAIVGKVNDLYINPNTKNNLDFLEAQLASSPDGGQYLCGKDLSAADLMMSFPVMALTADEKTLDKTKYPKLCAYAELLKANSVFQASIKKIEDLTGEKYELF